MGKRPPDGRTVEPPRKKYVCKHCKVEVVSKTNYKPIYGRSHGKHCPRRVLNG